MGQPSSPRQRRPYNRRHAAALLTLVAVIVTLVSFFSIDASATRNSPKQDIHLNEKSLSQIHASLSTAISVAPEQLVAPDIAAPVQEILPVEYKQTSVKIKPGYSLALIFRKYHLNQQDLYYIMKKGAATKALRNLMPGQSLQIQSDPTGQIHSLSYEINRLESINVSHVNNDFVVENIKRPLEKRVNFSTGVIQSSLFEAGKEAGLSDALVMEMAGIFGWDIDFALDIREGDKFSILYEEQFIDGKKYQTGNILAAEFTNQGKTFKAIGFTEESGRISYYTPEGLSMRKAFLRTPVDFRRISSRFGKRMHPTLNRMKMHNGVDYAAPRGTPIHVSGDGKVIFQGRKGGYGRVIIVKHGSRYQTVYAHMNGFKRGIHVGSRVRQGQTIGFVGSSGRATGPHLHYEFRVNGVHRNPLTIALPNSAPINPRYKTAFMAHARQVLAQIETYKPTRVALNEN